MKKEQLLQRLDQLLQLCESSINRAHGILDVHPREYKQFAIEAHAFLELLYDTDHKVIQDFLYHCDRQEYYHLEQCLSILKAVRSNIEGGWLNTQKGLLTAEIFEDFLGMAEHLLEENYIGPAAVLVGGILERQIREMSRNNEIPVTVIKGDKEVPLSTDKLNNELYKKGVYALSDQKQIVAWLDVRNNAAHGHFEKLSASQVELMMHGVRSFISRLS